MARARASDTAIRPATTAAQTAPANDNFFMRSPLLTWA